MMELANAAVSCASASVALSWRRTTWLCVHARSKTRSARRWSWYFSTRPRHASRLAPTPVTMSTVADCFGIERDSIADCDDRIQHRPLTARERRRTGHCLRIGDGVPTADEPHAVRLVGDFSDVRSMHSHQMEHPWSLPHRGSAAGGCRGSPAARGRSRSGRTDC